MNWLNWIALFLVITVAFAYPESNPRGCIYVHGICQRECEEGTVAYISDCDHFTPEPTCDEPDPQPDLSGILCDYTACYCAGDTVRDPMTNKCVAIDDCTKYT